MIHEHLPFVVVLGRVLLVLASFAANVFMVYYGISSPWYRYPLGWVVMLQAVTMALALNLSMVFTFLLDEQTRPFLLWANVGIIGAIMIVKVALIYMLWRIRRNAREGVSR